MIIANDPAFKWGDSFMNVHYVSVPIFKDIYHISHTYIYRLNILKYERGESPDRGKVQARLQRCDTVGLNRV